MLLSNKILYDGEQSFHLMMTGVSHGFDAYTQLLLTSEYPKG